tara:strand:+ start:362 stop:925 length:564 start_codon:yes stop_codon:yes gene_type:complete
MAIPLGEEIDSQIDDKMDVFLKRYSPASISSARKLMTQTNPLEFANQGTAIDVYIVDAKLNLPVAPHILQQQLVEYLSIPEYKLKVRNLEDPLNELDEPEDESPKEAIMGTDYSGDEAKNNSRYYGGEYNVDFLKGLESRKFEYASSESTAPQMETTEGNKTSPLSGQNSIPNPSKMSGVNKQTARK